MQKWLHRFRSLLAGFLKAFVQGLPRYAQTQCRNGLIALRAFQGFINYQLLGLFERRQLLSKGNQGVACWRQFFQVISGTRRFSNNMDSGPSTSGARTTASSST